MGGIGYVGFLSYAVSLWLVTGVVMLWIDVKIYELTGMVKEREVCRFIGWLNISLGLIAFAGDLVLWNWGV